jgi:WD40 repeat protein
LSLSFSPEPIVLAVGDSDGNVFLAAPTGTAPPRSARAESAVTALAFSRDRRLLASGDAAGGVRLWESATADRVGDPHVFRHPVRWLGFTQNGQFLLVQTNHWVHRLGVRPQGLFIVASRLLDVGLEAGAALTSPGGDQLRLVGRRVGSQPILHEVDLSRVGTAALAEDSPLLLRDWSRILGLRLDDSGAVVSVLP